MFQAEGIPANTTTTAVKQSISYKPPVSKNGYRLFACLELDGEDCGKKDHREIARQYCVKEGYTESQEFDVETRKGKAETLGGDEYCSKKMQRWLRGNSLQDVAFSSSARSGPLVQSGPFILG